MKSRYGDFADSEQKSQLLSSPIHHLDTEAQPSNIREYAMSKLKKHLLSSYHDAHRCEHIGTWERDAFPMEDEEVQSRMIWMLPAAVTQVVVTTCRWTSDVTSVVSGPSVLVHEDHFVGNVRRLSNAAVPDGVILRSRDPILVDDSSTQVLVFSLLLSGFSSVLQDPDLQVS